MRLTLTLLIFALLTAALAGCAGAGREYTAGDVQTLLDAGLFEGDMMEVDASAAESICGAAAEDIVEFKSVRAGNTAVSCDEVTVVVLVDGDSAKSAEETLRERLESMTENALAYTPAAVPRLEAAVLPRVGRSVLFAVGDPERLADEVGRLRE